MAADPYLALTDWRRAVAELYARWRADAPTDPETATLVWREARDRLYREHPQSPVPAAERAAFRGRWWPYDPAWRLMATLEPLAADAPGPHEEAAAAAPGSFASAIAAPASDGGTFRLRRIGTVRPGGPLGDAALPVLWVEGYGNGLFLPFRDATNGAQTYGAGRYLLDTVKGADQGGDAAIGTLVLDLNLAYHPSCAFDPRWVCPLAPPASRLAIAVPAGERLR
ncbi:MAG: DUF1684 domain-containing protein [Chloroflexota bacterium]